MPPAAAMTELILNVAWLAIAIGAFALAPRRDRRTVAALALLVALLFPIVSVSDDLYADSATLPMAILALAAMTIALVAMARIFSESRLVPNFVLVVHADPRSPPRR